jgi:integrase
MTFCCLKRQHLYSKKVGKLEINSKRIDVKKRNEYRNQWWPSNMDNVSKLVWEIGQEFSNSRIDDYDNQTGKSARKVRPGSLGTVSDDPTLATKAFYFLYLTGARLGEILQAPYPRCQLMPAFRFKNGATKDVILVTRLNEKHIDKKTGEREMLQSAIPVFNVYEERMWHYVLGSSKEFWQDVVLTDFEKLGGYKRQAAFSKYCIRHFKTRMQSRLNEKSSLEGISPHQLRHFRTYFLRINQGFDDRLTSGFFGWSSMTMVTHYSRLKADLKLIAQLELLKNQYMPIANNPKPEGALVIPSPVPI